MEAQGYACSLISTFALCVSGRVDSDNVVSFCCESEEIKPGVGLYKKPRETMEDLIRLRKSLISDGKPGAEKTAAADGCRKCVFYQSGKWKFSERITYVNFTAYPSPCQCKCTYCSVPKNDGLRQMDEGCLKYYKKMFELLEYAKKSQMMSPDIFYQVSSGEITIHPLKERFYSLVGNSAARFNTNCFIFDEHIAKKLKANPNSCINFSIDSGTGETWQKIKGFDNFDDVISNVAKYRSSASYGRQIAFKYIVLPGTNDNDEDFQGVISLMKKFKIPALEISRDVKDLHNQSESIIEAIVEPTVRLIAMLRKNDLTFSIQLYSSDELKRINARYESLAHQNN